MKKDQVFFWILIFFLPTQLGRHFWPNFSFVSGVRVDFLSPTLYLTDLLIMAILATFTLRVGRKFLKLFPRPILFFFAWLFFVSLLANSPPLAFFKLAKTLEFFLLGAYIYQERSFSFIGLPLSLAVFCQSLLAWGQFFKGESLSGPFWLLGERTFNLTSVNIAQGALSGRVFLRPYATFSHPNSLAGFFLVAAILIFQEKSLPLWWRSLVGALALTVLAISFSQVAWLAAGLAFLFFLVKKLKFKKRSFLPFLGFSFFLTTFGVWFLTSKTFLPEFQERITLSQIALRIISQNPLFGVGLGGFIPALPLFWEAKIFLLQPVHNFFLLVGAETGLFGLLLALVFFFFLFKRAFRDAYLLSAVFVIFWTGLFDHYWLTLQQNQLLLVLVAARVWSLPKRV